MIRTTFHKCFFLLMAMATTFVCSCSSDIEDRAKDLAKKALMASSENPESVKIKAISSPDSIFGREYITQEEKMALSMAMLKVNKQIMDQTDDLENLKMPDKRLTSLMERQMAAAAALRSVSPISPDAPKEKLPFSGWKVKVEYTAVDMDGIPYHSEYWCILNTDADCVVNSFEIPII